LGLWEGLKNMFRRISGPVQDPLGMDLNLYKVEKVIARISTQLDILWWRSGFYLSLVIRDPEIESRCRNALQGRRRDHSSQEVLLILKYKNKCEKHYIVIQ